MLYKLDHPSLEGEDILLKLSTLFGGAEIHHNGRMILEKATGTNIYTIKKGDGSSVTIALEPKKLDPFPRLEIEGEQFPIGRKLNPFDFIIIALPLLLIFIGGAIGGMVGFVAAALNARIMRMPNSALERYGFSMIVIVGALLTWYLTALGLTLVFSAE